MLAKPVYSGAAQSGLLDVCVVVGGIRLKTADPTTQNRHKPSSLFLSRLLRLLVAHHTRVRNQSAEWLIGATGRAQEDAGWPPGRLECAEDVAASGSTEATGAKL